MNKYQEALNNIRFYCGHANYDGYLNPKVFEELNIIQELVDKETPKKPIKIKIDYMEYYACPNCKYTFEGFNRCTYCGQRFRSDENE